MQPVDLIKRVGVFLAVFIVVGAAGTLVTASGGSPDTGFGADPVNVSSHATAAVIADQPEETGEVRIDAQTDDKTVMIDLSHTTAVDEFDLRPVVDTLSRNGHTVRLYDPQRATPRQFNATLRSADAVLIVAPTQRLSASEANGLVAFTQAGGRLAIFGEPEGGAAGGFGGVSFGFGNEQSQAEVAPVTSQLGMSVGSGYLYNIDQNVNNHANINVTPDATTPLTDGVQRVVVHQATPVQGPTTLLQTAPSSELSSTRRASAYGVAATSENTVVVGDASILAPEWVYLADNEVFVGNVLEFLVTGDKQPSNAPEPAGPSGPRG